MTTIIVKENSPSDKRIARIYKDITLYHNRRGKEKNSGKL